MEGRLASMGGSFVPALLSDISRISTQKREIQTCSHIAYYQKGILQNCRLLSGNLDQPQN
jgi:hypothetical protein